MSKRISKNNSSKTFVPKNLEYYMIFGMNKSGREKKDQNSLSKIWKTTTGWKQYQENLNTRNIFQIQRYLKF